MLMKNITCTIKQLINEHGLSIIEQEQRMKAILADLHPDEKRFRYLLDISILADIPRKLISLQSMNTNIWEKHVTSLKRYFKEEFSLEDAAVNSVFECWIEIFPGQKVKTSLFYTDPEAQQNVKPQPLTLQYKLPHPFIQPTVNKPKFENLRLLELSVLLNHLNHQVFIPNIGRVIQIGKQWWMAENLNVTQYRNGDVIPNVNDCKDWGSLTKGAYCYYNNNPENGSKYGKLYNWLAVSDKRNIAPKGWHVASEADWATLFKELGGEEQAYSKLIDVSFTKFFIDNSRTFGGRRSWTGEYIDEGKGVLFWRSTGHNSINVKSIYLSSIPLRSLLLQGPGFDGSYIRCVRD